MTAHKTAAKETTRKRERQNLFLISLSFIIREIEKYLIFTTNATIFTLLHKRLKGNRQKFKSCRLPFSVVVLNLSNVPNEPETDSYDIVCHYIALCS